MPRSRCRSCSAPVRSVGAVHSATRAAQAAVEVRGAEVARDAHGTVQHGLKACHVHLPGIDRRAGDDSLGCPVPLPGRLSPWRVEMALCVARAEDAPCSPLRVRGGLSVHTHLRHVDVGLVGRQTVLPRPARPTKKQARERRSAPLRMLSLPMPRPPRLAQPALPFNSKCGLGRGLGRVHS